MSCSCISFENHLEHLLYLLTYMEGQRKQSRKKKNLQEHTNFWFCRRGNKNYFIWLLGSKADKIIHFPCQQSDTNTNIKALTRQRSYHTNIINYAICHFRDQHAVIERENTTLMSQLIHYIYQMNPQSWPVCCHYEG